MKLSLNWLKDYVSVDLSPDKISEILTDIGLEVEGMEETESIKGGLRGVVVGEVKTCEKHPNADKLSLTTVDIGEGEPLQIVCGAPNVAAGQKVLVATTGTTLYSPEGEEWKIKKGKIRGVESVGMICAEDELGLGTSHDGIMVLPEEVEVGKAAADHFQVTKDVVYEIGLTPNRSDATSHLGAAKDLAAALKINYNHSGKVNTPNVAGFKIDNHDLPIEVIVEDTDACPRYSGISLKNVTIKESPNWLKNKLSSIGVRPINNVVDITNFILHELGQPLHAFDLDKITGRKIIVKKLAEGTPFLALDETERKLSSQDLMICDGEGEAMCIGGVFGGLTSGVSDSTKNIFLESAHFNAGSIRRSSSRHLLRTDAAIVFEKGSDPNLTVFALKRAAILMKELADAEIASDIVDIYPNKIEPRQITVTFHNVKRLIGIDIPHQEIIDILEAMKMEIIHQDDKKFTVAVPTDKADVLREADIIEEILRIYGFNKVPVTNHVNSAISYAQKPDPQEIRNIAANHLVSNGFHEMMALSLSESRYYKEVIPLPEESLVFINNTSNIHLDIMRPMMLISGLEAIVRNQNRSNTDLKLFEFGKSYRKAENGFVEKEHLTVYLTGKKYPENWLVTGKEDVNFFTLKAHVENILRRFNILRFQSTEFEDEVFDFGLKYHRGKQVLVRFGAIQRSILRKMSIKNDVFYAIFEWEAIMAALANHHINFEPLNKFPTVRRDLALVIDKTVKFTEIVKLAQQTDKKILKEISLFDVYENEEQLGKGKKSYAISFIFENHNKTLKDKEVDKVMKKLIHVFEQKIGSFVRQ